MSQHDDIKIIEPIDNASNLNSSNKQSKQSKQSSSIDNNKVIYNFYNSNNQSFGFDLGLTEDCNFACKYCIERGYFTPHQMEEEVYTRVVEKAKYILYNTNYSKDIKFGLWGGEPTLNAPAIEYIVNEFYGNRNISYGLFTNGKILDWYYDMIHNICDSGQRFQIQISYDGLPIHNANRIDRCNGNTTGEMVRARILETIKEKLPMHLKSTITYNDFDKIYDSYMDICELESEALSIDPNYRGYASISYAPTIDYSMISYNKLNDENMKEYLQIFEEQLLKIAKNEYKRYKNNQRIIFNWFERSKNSNLTDKIKCSAGNRYKAINYNGDVLACHGCVFLESMNDHYICSVFDNNKDFVDRLYSSDKRYNVHTDNYSRLAEECNKCDACICLVCNCIKYQMSKKQNYIDRWWDTANQPRLCEFYKLASNIIKALIIKCNLSSISNNDNGSIDIEVRQC